MMSNLPQRTVLGQIGKEKRFLLKVNLFIAYILKGEGQPNVIRFSCRHSTALNCVYTITHETELFICLCLIQFGKAANSEQHNL